VQATFWPGGRVPADGHLALWGTGDLPAAVAALGAPPGVPAQLPTAVPASARARRKVVEGQVEAMLLPVRGAILLLAGLPTADAWPQWQRPGDSLLAWSVATKLALEHVAAGNVVPVLRPGGPDRMVAAWRLAAPAGDRRFAALADAMPPAAHALRRDEDDGTIWTAADLLAAFVDAVADACARAPGPHSTRTATRGSLGTRWATALTSSDPVVELDAHDGTGPRTGDGRSRDRGASDGRGRNRGIGQGRTGRATDDGRGRDRGVGEGAAESLADDVARWAAPLAGTGPQAAARLCVQLHTPVAAEPDEPWPLDYHLQAADEPSLMVPADQVWQTGSRTLDALGGRFVDPQEALVRGLAEAARLFPPIDASLSHARPTGLDLAPSDAAAFLADGAGTLAGAGLGVLLPAELTAKGARKLRARLRMGATAGDPGAGITGAGLNEETLGAFHWEAAIGDDSLTAQEFADIVALKQPLVLWKGQWVRLDPGEAATLADLVGTTGEVPPGEALSVALAGERASGELGAVEVVADGVLRTLVDRLRAASDDREPRLEGIDAILRAYQRTGVAWLQTLSDLGIGALLADDMGLGKTVQTIALLAARDGTRPHLVVCPTSVVGNWERELARFAPALPVLRHHGPDRPDDPAGFPGGTVAVTTYGLLRRDADMLADVDWDVVVLDEAQQIKNHAARTARAARRLTAVGRVALTGTPVENRLSELWSIMEFANPGLLGRFTHFRERYAVPVERWRDPEAAAQLRRIAAPFMLRRLKSDPAIAAGLPPKIEATVACTLTREQATLYQAAVDTLLDENGDGLGEGIERRARILKLLTALKQICNHPAHYLGEAGPLTGRSGKLARTTEMLAEAVDAGDRALVFTQYRVMGDLLVRHLTSTLGLPAIPFLHGGVTRARRDTMVAVFQDGSGPPLMVVSLKAGGTGLNLTAATHVVHYDRWWNPAVEDQATDRAYRIGQTRTVNVHKLVTGGTLEERIATLLDDKRTLADAVVGTGETWLTELSDDDIRALVALSSDDIGEPDDNGGADDETDRTLATAAGRGAR
jgi:SNF2-related domain/SNF2 Helicase protein/Helicase conserved C-terminal domain